VKNWDTIIVGAGIIGLTLAIELHKRGAKVLVVERGEPGREASSAAGGMLVDSPLETHAALQTLAIASARMYPEFAYELEVESGAKVDLRDQGAIVFLSEPRHEGAGPNLENLLPSRLSEIEPALAHSNRPAIYLKERSVDPRGVTAAAIKTAKKRGIDFSSGDPVTAVPGLSPRSPVITVRPVLVTVAPARIAKSAADPRGIVVWGIETGVIAHITCRLTPVGMTRAVV